MQTEIKPLTIQDVIRSAVKGNLITIEDCKIFDEHYYNLGSSLRTQFKQLASHTPAAAINYLKLRSGLLEISQTQDFTPKLDQSIPITVHDRVLPALMERWDTALIASPIGIVRLTASKVQTFFAQSHTSGGKSFSAQSIHRATARSQTLRKAGKIEAEVTSIDIYLLEDVGPTMTIVDFKSKFRDPS